MMGRILLLWWIMIVSLACVANPCIAIVQFMAGNFGGAALFSLFSIVSWLVARVT